MSSHDPSDIQASSPPTSTKEHKHKSIGLSLRKYIYFFYINLLSHVELGVKNSVVSTYVSEIDQRQFSFLIDIIL